MGNSIQIKIIDGDNSKNETKITLILDFIDFTPIQYVKQNKAYEIVNQYLNAVSAAIPVYCIGKNIKFEKIKNNKKLSLAKNSLNNTAEQI